MESCEGHRLHRRENLSWFEPDSLLGGCARVVMTTRHGGYSRDSWAGLNLGFHVGDLPERVRLNRLRIFQQFDSGLQEPAAAQQTHGSLAAPVGALHSGANWQALDGSLAGADAMVTAAPALPLLILVADCLPVCLVDPENRVLAAVHAGRQGLADGILTSALDLMRETWNSRPENLTAWLGPSIGACCYQVRGEVARQFPLSSRPDGDRWRLDLRAEAHHVLQQAGLPDENLIDLALCTCCRTDLFFSHRAAVLSGGGAAGRMAMFAWLQPAEPRR